MTITPTLPPTASSSRGTRLPYCAVAYLAQHAECHPLCSSPLEGETDLQPWPISTGVRPAKSLCSTLPATMRVVDHRRGSATRARGAADRRAAKGGRRAAGSCSCTCRLRRRECSSPTDGARRSVACCSLTVDLPRPLLAALRLTAASPRLVVLRCRPSPCSRRRS